MTGHEAGWHALKHRSLSVLEIPALRLVRSTQELLRIRFSRCALFPAARVEHKSERMGRGLPWPRPFRAATGLQLPEFRNMFFPVAPDLGILEFTIAENFLYASDVLVRIRFLPKMYRCARIQVSELQLAQRVNARFKQRSAPDAPVGIDNEVDNGFFARANRPILGHDGGYQGFVGCDLLRRHQY
jgi:hypothetical protein